MRALFLAVLLFPVSAPAVDVMELLVAECSASWSRYGPSMVQRCIQTNRQTAHVLAMYPLSMEPIIDGCIQRSRVRHYPLQWGVVRLCVRRDVNALVDLDNLPAYRKPAIKRCSQSHGRYGWHMVMLCSIK